MATCVIVGSAATRLVGARRAAAAGLHAALRREGGEMIDPRERRIESTGRRRRGRSTMTTGRPSARAAAILP